MQIRIAQGHTGQYTSRHMPAKLDVNREAVQVLVGAVGVREAARQAGLNENTVLAWANRGGWTVHAETARTVAATNRALRAEKLQPSAERLQSVAIKPADAMRNVLEDRGMHTKLSLSRYALRASARAATLKSSELLAEAQNVKAVASTAATIHGWEAKQPTSQVMVSVNMLGVRPDEVQAQAHVVEQDSTDVEQA